MINPSLLTKSNIVWKHKIVDNLTMVYGFEKDNKFNSVILTLYKQKDKTFVFGFLSKILLTPGNFWNLWKYLKSIINSEYLIFEVFSEHAKVYKKYIPVIKEEKIVAFNGRNIELLTVKLK